MENRHPGPDGTENSTNTQSNKAEHVAAWFQRRHEYDRHILFADKTEKGNDDEDDEEDEKGTGKKAHRLRLGALTVQDRDAKPEPKVESANHADNAQAQESNDAPDQHVEVRDSQDAEYLELPTEPEHIAEVVTSDVADHEADFEQWEQELAAQGPEAGSADMQMAEDDDAEDDHVHIPRQRTGSSASAHHQPRRYSSTPRTHAATPLTAASAVYVQQSSSPAAASGGGGGRVPPMPPVGSPLGPSNPNGPNNPNAFNVFNSSNTLVSPVNPNVQAGHNPNKITDHEHEHGHPRMALATAAAIIVEHMVGKHYDKRIDRASRQRDAKLHEQIDDTRTMHEQVRQKTEAQQLELANEQARQRRVLETIRSATNNVERPIAAGRPERVVMPNTYVEAAVDAELRQDIEQATLKTVEAEARSQSKVVMERVAVAAEFDEPVERVYERRQEVKDEPSTPGGASGGASSIGSVLAKNGSTAGQQSAHGSSTGQNGSTGDPYHGNDPRHLDYRAAAIRGVGAGLAVIVLALMAYLLL